MDFSLLSATMDQIIEDQRAPAANPSAIEKPRAPLQLDADKELKAVQQRKRESELSHRQKAKKSKQIERSQGYLDRLAQSEKQKQRGGCRKPRRQSQKCSK